LAHFLFETQGQMVATQVKHSLNDLLAPVVSGLGYEFVGLEFMPQGGRSLLRIYIDSESGVNLDDCERVSHQVSGVLEVEDPIRGQYILEVSSPGADRPLFTREHYERFVGRRVKIRLVMAVNGQRNFTGVLQGLRGDNVVVMEDNKEIEIPFGQIDKGKLVPEADQGGVR
jgi:ribosome maturation factor RimP